MGTRHSTAPGTCGGRFATAASARLLSVDQRLTFSSNCRAAFDVQGQNQRSSDWNDTTVVLPSSPAYSMQTTFRGTQWRGPAASQTRVELAIEKEHFVPVKLNRPSSTRTRPRS